MPKEHDEKTQRRLRREAETVEAMIRIYCRDKHGGSLCEECAALRDYSVHRVSRCPHGLAKPNCKDCTIHCFREPNRTHIHEVMRYAGPRMLRRHPLMAIRHLWVQWKTKRAGRRTGP